MMVGDDWSAMEPHNLYLLLLAEHGLFAALGYFLALVVVLVVVVRAPVLGDPVARSEKAVFVGIWWATMLMFSTASWPLINQKFSVFFWLFLFSCLHWAYGRFAQKSGIVSVC
jgi:O-antigen ligase